MQVRVADLLSTGYLQTEAAQDTGTPLRTVQRWCADPNFEDYVLELIDVQRAQWNRQFRRIVRKAMQLEEDVMDGKVSGIDPRAIRAHEILSKTAYRVAALGTVDRSPVRPGLDHKAGYLTAGTT